MSGSWLGSGSGLRLAFVLLELGTLYVWLLLV